jgi:MFS family permease
MIFINFGRNSIVAIKTQYLSLDDGFNVSSRLLSYIVNMESLAILLMGIFIARLSRHYRDFFLLLLGAVTAIMSLSGYALANSLPFIFPSNFLAGVSEVLIFAASYSYVSRLIPPEQRGRRFALFNATNFLSWGVAGTLIAGPIIDSLLERGVAQIVAYRVSFLSSTVLVVIGLIVLFATEQMNQRISTSNKKVATDLQSGASY